MDLLLETLESEKKGYKYGPRDEDRVTSFCYADNNAITSGNMNDMNDNLGIVKEFCNITGMRLNIRTFACFSIIPAGKNTYTVNTNAVKIKIADEEVPCIRPDGMMKYLGSKMSPWWTKVRKNIPDILNSMIKNISSSCLKPRQKLVVLQYYALPRLTYPLTQDQYPHHILDNIDKRVREAVRVWLKLPDCSPISLFHLPRAKGGLGIPQFRLCIPA
jgi:hypothetical protein